MSHVGQVAILLGLVVALYGSAVAAVGARTARPALVDSACRCAYVLLAMAVLINGAMLVALLRNDFTLRYVAENSSRSTPTFYKVLALWAADDGSLLLWNLVLAGYVAAVALRFRRNRPPTFAYALSVLLAVQVFYLTIVSGPARPFAPLADVPLDGRGPSPLLQNHPLMAVHPPFLYLGFIGFTVPFAFGIAALLVGRSGVSWAATTRRWTLAVWCFLTVGLLLGALWSYSVLGWGGYWAWDPVENVALLPWLVATAFVHSAMLEERRGIGRLWNVVLVISAFALMTFGTFLTRGNVLTSIHAFTESAVGPAYLAFLAVALLGGFGLVAWRLPQLRADARLDSALSREAAFIGNNVLLLSATAIILLGTAFPLVVEAVTGDQITIGAPYFRTALAPVFLLLLLLVGTAPRLGWRATDSGRAMRRLRLPVLTAAVVVVGTALAGVRQPEAVAGFGLAALAAMSNAQEIGPNDAPELYGIVADLAQRGGLPMPRVYIIDEEQPNAFATGRNPENAAVAATTGLLRHLSREEITGVMAHELSHVRHRDTLTMTIAATLSGAIGMLASFGGLMGGGRDENGRPMMGGVAAIAMMILAPLAASLVQMAISRSREYEADRMGAEMSGQPLWLASALAKLHAGTQQIPNQVAEANPATAHLYIANPLSAGGLRGLFSTHPPMEERIARLEAMAGQTSGYARPQMSPNGPWAQPAPQTPRRGPWG